MKKERISTGDIARRAESLARPCGISVGDTVSVKNRGEGFARKIYFWVKRKDHNFRFEWRVNVDLPDGNTKVAKFRAELDLPPEPLVYMGNGNYRNFTTTNITKS